MSYPFIRWIWSWKNKDMHIIFLYLGTAVLTEVTGDFKTREILSYVFVKPETNKASEQAHIKRSNTLIDQTFEGRSCLKTQYGINVNYEMVSHRDTTNISEQEKGVPPVSDIGVSVQKWIIKSFCYTYIFIANFLEYTSVFLQEFLKAATTVYIIEDLYLHFLPYDTGKDVCTIMMNSSYTIGDGFRSRFRPYDPGKSVSLSTVNSWSFPTILLYFLL